MIRATAYAHCDNRLSTASRIVGEQIVAGGMRGRRKRIGHTPLPEETNVRYCRISRVLNRPASERGRSTSRVASTRRVCVAGYRLWSPAKGG